ncbi:LysR family transcriptional regulator [Streptomyces sp. NPDC048172]|uniref:LysR family transcriptional regulator n=1 Tax=Streptomyces sp. NPDC048172 TaxID=3365505 RepID=UPI0037195B90
MEIRQLEYFVAVAEERSFTRAAARLHVAQPGVSTQIRQLERELKQELLDRSGRAVRLTDIGATVLPYAREALAALSRVREAVDEHAGLLRGRVSLGMVTSSASAYDLPRLLAEFHKKHPAIEVTLAEAASDELLNSLHAGRFDAVAISPPTTDLPDVGTLTVADEPLVAAVAHAHPLAGRTTLRLAELRDEPLITFHESVGARATVEAACTEAGFPPRIAFEASDPALLADLATTSLGVAILPAPYARTRPDSLRTIPLTDPPMRAHILIAWRTTAPMTPATRALVTHLRDAVEAPGPLR